ncbi:T9SS type A sorting domain-containing protein [Cryomorpha ignava]|uniref:T9SS type A sorting domain-containing protein n=1 Tax=Cryomorpha ignava TaxID=101383 RepID=A0A7K3WU24_9FLAO|nr:alpha-amylase family glycosyl hydrolase [Cryomorpha ignava]NEN25004.1 T9SS type A sorting domain-containing protein [Cryomorpha ignava]
MLKRLSFFFLSVFLTVQLTAQIVSIDPPFATQLDDITITYNAALGNAGVIGVQPVYAHTGVILEGESGWQNVQGNWGTADANVVMTPLGNNLHEISFNITDFYNLQPGDVVEQLAFVFRNANGSLEGKTADGNDIFVAIYSNVFAGSITEPFQPVIFFDPPANVNFTAQTNEPATITLYLDDASLSSQTAVSELSYSVNLSGEPAGQYWLWMEADNGATTITDSTYIIIQGAPVVAAAPAGVIDGINYIDDETVILQIYAPFKDFIYVLGDFNNWQFHPEYFTKVTPEGDRFWLEISDLNPGQEYRFQYAIDEQDMRVADIYADKILDPWNDPYIPESVYPDLIEYPSGLTTEIVSVFQTAQPSYNWQVENFDRPDENKLIIYELLIRDWDENHSYQSVTDRLDYLETLGVNAIELMPFTEFEGNESWGYNPMFYFAADKYYGPKDALKALVDECHLRGIAVIQDVVFNHSFGQNPQLRMYSQSGGPAGPPSANSPFFNVTAKHPFNVGYDYDHSQPIVQEFVRRNLQYWVEEYKIDGFRFDLSKGFTQNQTNNVSAWNQYDQSRVDNWFRIRDEIYSYDPDVYMILEHLGNNNEETVLANGGMMLWGNINHEYNEASMGYPSNLNWADYQNRNWNDPKLVSYAESHDEERLMYKNLEFGNSATNYDITELETALARQEAIAAFLIPLAGPKMIWQFGELGYDYSINYCPNGTIDPDCRVANKPIRWDYYDEPARQRLYKVNAALNKLKTENEAFTSTNYTWDVGAAGKRLIIEHQSMDVVIIANFDVTPITLVPGFTHTGTWYDYMLGTTIIEDNLNNGFLLQPGEYRIYTDVELETPDLTVGLASANKKEEAQISVYPNPFQHFTNISYQLEQTDRVEVRVMDISGKLVKTLFAGQQAQGNHTLNWDGTDNAGGKAASGIYAIQITTGQTVGTSKVVCIR